MICSEFLPSLRAFGGAGAPPPIPPTIPSPTPSPSPAPGVPQPDVIPPEIDDPQPAESPMPVHEPHMPPPVAVRRILH